MTYEDDRTWHYKIFCVNGNTGFRNESRIFYFIHLQKEGKHSKKCTFYTLRFGCSFAAVNTIKPQLL